MSDTVNVNLTVNGYALDPSRSYIIEVKSSDFSQHELKGLVNALQQLSIKHVILATENGDSVNVVEVPENSEATS